MNILLFTVEEIVYTKDLGTVLYPGISSAGPRAKVGQRITVVRPNGESLETTIRDLPMINHKRYKNSVAVALPKNITAELIPIGCQVWLTDEDDTP